MVQVNDAALAAMKSVKEKVIQLEKEKSKLEARVKELQREWEDTWDVVELRTGQRDAAKELLVKVFRHIEMKKDLDPLVVEWNQFRSQNIWI